MGWSTYFAFILAAINTLTITYFLAIENYPFLKSIFPSFEQYIIIIISIGIPILIAVGFAHFKRTAAYRTEAEITWETNPFLRRMLMNSEIVIPLQMKLTEIIIKLSRKENASEKDISEIQKILDDVQNHFELKQESKYNVYDSNIHDKLKNLDEVKNN
tara:strand:- start:122 stop:598 length:477 start_codon:yes stop_codon:yes gene_type:complete